VVRQVGLRQVGRRKINFIYLLGIAFVSGTITALILAADED